MNSYFLWMDWALPVRFKYQPSHNVPGDPLAQCSVIVVQLGPVIFMWRFL